VALLCIWLLCSALSDVVSVAPELWGGQQPPCTATLVIRRQVLTGSPATRVTVNGASPGPVLRCALGRPVRFTVVNELHDDATTVHWHGLGQRGTPWADGVVGVSQARVESVIL
jgi:FtsP/CotA-like multicopper oxidase with cupredoxin domain